MSVSSLLKLVAPGFLGAFLMIVSGSLAPLGQEAAAVEIIPDVPDYAWLFDGTGTALVGGVDGTSVGAGYTTDTPFSYGSNRALTFDGNDQFNIPDTPGLRLGTSAWTTSFWFKSSNTNQFGPLVGKRKPTPNYNQFAVIQGTILSGGSASPSAKLSVLFRNTAGQNNWFHTNDDVVDGDWHQVVVVRDGVGNNVVYVDGVSKALTQVALTGTQPLDIDNTDQWALGWNNQSTYFQGQIDEVAFWNSAISEGNAEWLAANQLASVIPIPEPSSLLLLSGTLICLRTRTRRKELSSH